MKNNVTDCLLGTLLKTCAEGDVVHRAGPCTHHTNRAGYPIYREREKPLICVVKESFQLTVLELNSAQIVNIFFFSFSICQTENEM